MKMGEGQTMGDNTNIGCKTQSAIKNAIELMNIMEASGVPIHTHFGIRIEEDGLILLYQNKNVEYGIGYNLDGDFYLHEACHNFVWNKPTSRDLNEIIFLATKRWEFLFYTPSYKEH